MGYLRNIRAAITPRSTKIVAFDHSFTLHRVYTKTAWHLVKNRVRLSALTGNRSEANRVSGYRVTHTGDLTPSRYELLGASKSRGVQLWQSGTLLYPLELMIAQVKVRFYDLLVCSVAFWYRGNSVECWRTNILGFCDDVEPCQE